MEKWNSIKAKELGFDANLLNAVNVAVKVGRQELDALVNDDVREGQYKAACKEIDAKRKVRLESDLKVFGSPCGFNPVYQLPLLGWSGSHPGAEDIRFETIFKNLEPIWSSIEIPSGIVGEDRFESLINSLNGFMVKGILWWLVDSEDEVYDRIARFNSRVLSSIREFDNDTKGKYDLYKLISQDLVRNSHSITPKELCTPSGVRNWLLGFGGVGYSPIDNFDYNGYGTPYSEKDRAEFVYRSLPYPPAPCKVGGGVVDRHTILKNFIHELYPEKKNNSTITQVITALFS